MTPTQHRNIANGIDRLKECCFKAYMRYEFGYQIIGTYFSNRFKK